MADRFCFTTDPAIGVPGYYKHRKDGTIDTRVRYDALPTDDGGHRFVKSEHQYVQVGQPVTLEMESGSSMQLQVDDAKQPLIERLLGR